MKKIKNIKKTKRKTILKKTTLRKIYKNLKIRTIQTLLREGSNEE